MGLIGLLARWCLENGVGIVFPDVGDLVTVVNLHLEVPLVERALGAGLISVLVGRWIRRVVCLVLLSTLTVVRCPPAELPAKGARPSTSATGERFYSPFYRVCNTCCEFLEIDL
jgi:hypothetical protein